MSAFPRLESWLQILDHLFCPSSQAGSQCDLEEIFSLGFCFQSCPTLCDAVDCGMPRLPCPSPSPGACSDSCPLSWWCYPTISFSVIPFSSCLQSFPASGSFPVSQLFTSGGQTASISPSSEYSGLISFRIDWFDLLAVQGSLKSLLQHHSSKASIL